MQWLLVDAGYVSLSKSRHAQPYRVTTQRVSISDLARSGYSPDALVVKNTLPERRNTADQSLKALQVIEKLRISRLWPVLFISFRSLSPCLASDIP
jgi:hypothetical protein